jgi:DNA mismatch repair protein MutH
MAIPNTGNVKDLFGFKAEAAANAQKGSILNIYVANADPKAVVDAVGKYVKQNGALPSYFYTGQARR